MRMGREGKGREEETTGGTREKAREGEGEQTDANWATTLRERARRRIISATATGARTSEGRASTANATDEAGGGGAGERRRQRGRAEALAERTTTIESSRVCGTGPRTSDSRLLAFQTEHSLVVVIVGRETKEVGFCSVFRIVGLSVTLFWFRSRGRSLLLRRL